MSGVRRQTDEPLGRAAFGHGSGSGEHRCPSAGEAIHNGFADAFGSASDQDPFTVEFGRLSWLWFV